MIRKRCVDYLGLLHLY